MPSSAPSARATKAWELAHAELSMLLERYQVLGVIGQGGMGTVFKGYHVNLKRHVAIKTLRIDKITTPDSVSRFRQEMELVGQMDHPNVVRATDAGEKNGVFYLVMEFLSGCDLGTLVHRNGPMDLPNACELIRQAALGLHYIHQTLVHRDIKPSNLMLTSGGLVKILDLGLARCDLATLSEREETPFGYAVGTFSYMAPEQAGGVRNIDGRADIYSLGCTLFKLLSGKTPFSGPAYDNAAKQLNAHCNVPLTSVEEFHALPEKIKPVLLRMTAKDPDERYATALEVAETLAAFVGSSQPARLLGEATEAPVAPVPTPAPAELTRLTESYAETPQDTLAASTPTTSTHTVSQASFWTSGRFRRTIAIGAAVLSVGILAWAVAPHLSNRVGAPLDLDHVPLNEPVFLLAHEPLPIGCDRGDNTRYLWSKNEQRLTIPTGRQTLFQLGTTSRTSFTFDADLQQGSPWSGKVGIYWGYHEDAALNDPDVPNRKFAWFHYLLFAHRVDDGVHRTWVHRGYGYLRYNRQGEITAPGANTAESEAVGILGGRQNVLVEIRNNRLVRARVGNVELKDTVAPTIDPEVQKQPCQGGFGVFSTGEAVTVSNVRFILHSKK